MTTAFGTIADGAIQAVIAILPIALPVMGAMITIALGIRLFRKLTARG